MCFKNWRKHYVDLRPPFSCTEKLSLASVQLKLSTHHLIRRGRVPFHHQIRLSIDVMDDYVGQTLQWHQSHVESEGLQQSELLLVCLFVCAGPQGKCLSLWRHK